MADNPNLLATKTYDAKTGKVVSLAPDQVRTAFDSGAVGFKKDSNVQMKFADGSVRDVPVSDVSQLLDQGVADFATQGQAKEQHLENKFGKEGSLRSLANKAMVLQDAAQKGLTLGLTDAAKVGIAGMFGKGQEERDYIRESREYAPIAAATGEIAGATLGALIPGMGQARAGVAVGKGALTLGQLGVRAAEGAEALGAAARAAEAIRMGEAGSGLYGLGNEALQAGKGAEGLLRTVAVNGTPWAERAAAETIAGGSGAKGALAKAFEFMPAALQESAGARMETAVASKIPDASNIFQRVIAEGTKLAARGATEGGIQGVADQLNEDLLGDVNVRADKLFMSGLHGALFGGAIGGTMGAGAGLLSKGPSKLATETISEGVSKLEGSGTMERIGEGMKADEGTISKIMSKLFGFEPVQKMGDRYAQLAKVSAGEGANLIERMGAHRMDSSAKAARQLISKSDEIIDRGTRDTVQALQDMHKAIGSVMEESTGALKKSHVEKLVRKEATDELSEHAFNTFAGMQQEVGGLLADRLNTSAFKKSLGNLRDTYASLEPRMLKAIASGDVAEQYMVLDSAKRALGTTEAGIAKTPPGKSLANQQKKPLSELLKNSYASIKANLEDESTWGKIGRTQAEINNAWSGQIAHGRDFRSKFVAQLGQDAMDSWSKEQFIKPDAVASYVKNLTNPNNDLTHMTVREYVSRTKQLAKSVADNLDLAHARKAEVQKALAAAEKAEKTIASLEGTVTDANQMQKLMVSEKGSGLLEMAGPILGGFASGGFLGAGIAGVLGGAMRAISRPGHTIMQLAALEAMDAKVSAQISKAAKGIIRGGEIPKMQIKFRAAGQDIRRAYTQAVENVDKLERNQDQFASEARKVPAIAPKSAGAYILGLQRAVNYLAQERPVALGNTYLRADENTRISDQEMAKFVRKYETVKDPMSAIRDFQSGRITPEQVHALAATAPEALRELRTYAVEEIAKAPLNYDAKLRAAVLLDQPTDWSLSPDGIKTLQASAQAAGSQAQSPGAPPKKPNGSKSVASVIASTGLPLDKLAQSGPGRRR